MLQQIPTRDITFPHIIASFLSSKKKKKKDIAQ